MAASRVYHEPQSRALCGVHALNALAQAPIVSKAVLDEVARELDTATASVERRGKWRGSRHRTAGAGNYSVEVLMVAAERAGMDVTWWDTRKAVRSALDKVGRYSSSSAHDVAAEGGLLINVTVRRRLFSKTRHWFALVCVDDVWYNCDSKFKAGPAVIGDDAAAEAWVGACVASTKARAQVFVVAPLAASGSSSGSSGNSAGSGASSGGSDGSASGACSASDNEDISSDTISITSSASASASAT